jgi:hypothetical protein
MSVVDVQIPAHIQAVVDHLNDRGVLCGYGERPDGAGFLDGPHSQFVPYAVVWRSGAIDAQSSMLTGDVDEARPSVQVDAVGSIASEADDLAGDVMVAMLDQSIVIPGRRVLRVWQEVGNTAAKDPGSTGGMGVSDKPPLYKSADRYRIWSVPD